jgi:alpha-mannosidase
MLDMPTASSQPADRLGRAIDRLRQLTQLDLQTQWRLYEADLPIDAATQVQTWKTWKTASLNDRDHIAWEKGQRVLWLGQQLTVPAALQGYPLAGMTLRLALIWWAEAAQVFVNGKLVQEGDLFDCQTRILLSPNVTPGETIDLAIRLVSPGHDNGALVRSICLYEQPDRRLDPCPEPGFVADELAVLQIYLSQFAPNQLAAVEAAIDSIPWEEQNNCSKFDQAMLQVRQQLQPLSNLIKQRTIYLLGHAHLDLAWLWSIDNTWEAAQRTFQSVLSLQKDFPDLIFGHSTPALYNWIETNRPDLFTAIQAQIKTGRWEVIAGLWVEPELNLISGESLVRQVLYGQRYVREKFGQVSKIAWLPDSFGFCWQLPQILKQGGVTYFVTQKLRWNDTTQFPHEVFEWQAPDGSQIFSLNSAPIGEGIDPVKMANYAAQWETQTKAQISLWLPGVGDHGGGPSRDMLELVDRWQHSPFFPKLEFQTALEFLQDLENGTQQKAVEKETRERAEELITHDQFPTTNFPIWNSELYLEFHRGCYTTHADQKRSNRLSERLLYEAELFASIATLLTQAPYPQQDIESAWKQVLFNQFHDILPGSAIPEVFIEANQMWQSVITGAENLTQQALQSIAAQISLPSAPHPEAQPIVVFNSLNWERSHLVTLEIPASSQTHWQVQDLQGNPIDFYSHAGRSNPTGKCLTFQANHIPAIGYCCFWLIPSSSFVPHPASLSFVLENEFLTVSIDPQTGDLSQIFDKQNQRQVLCGAGNPLEAFVDQGQYWDAWNIDPEYAKQPLPAAELVEIRSIAQNRLETRIQVSRKIGQSTFWQTYVLQQGSPVLTIETEVDWQERHTLVKAAFPLNLESDFATYEIPFGAIDRPTRPRSDREKAQWEVPALNWAELSDGTYGVSILSDCKHGYDSQPNQLRLTLLRGSEWPNPDADRGWHKFTYAIYPHAESWQSAQTVRRGYELTHPLLTVILDAQNAQNTQSIPQPVSASSLPAIGQFLTLEAENLILSALKQSETDPMQWVVRCYEAHGKPTDLAWQSSGLLFTHALETQTAQLANLLEDPIHPIDPDSISIAPWKIITLSFQQKPLLNPTDSIH